jgi:dihydroorotase
MSHVLSKFLYLGYSLEEIIDAVTVNAAKWLNKPELGRISVGDLANLTLFTVEDGVTSLLDSEGEERKAEQKIVVKGVVINGEHVEC